MNEYNHQVPAPQTKSEVKEILTGKEVCEHKSVTTNYYGSTGEGYCHDCDNEIDIKTGEILK